MSRKAFALSIDSKFFSESNDFSITLFSRDTSFKVLSKINFFIHNLHILQNVKLSKKNKENMGKSCKICIYI